LRGIEAELDGGLIGGLPEVSEEVPDLLLRSVDDVTDGGLVDGGGHILTELLEAATQLFQEGGGGNGRFEGHELLLGGAKRAVRPVSAAELPSQRRRSRKICHARRGIVTSIRLERR
jgi:hypothetical protein